MATARIRLHHDLSPSKATKGSTGSKDTEPTSRSKEDKPVADNQHQTSRAGGFLCPPTAELSSLFNQGSSTKAPHSNIYDHSLHHHRASLEASPHANAESANRSRSRSGGVIAAEEGSGNSKKRAGIVSNNFLVETFLEEESAAGVAAPNCFCGTCTSCTFRMARRVPRQLMARGNDALGGVGSKKLDQLERDTQRAQVRAPADLYTDTTSNVFLFLNLNSRFCSSTQFMKSSACLCCTLHFVVHF